MIFRFWDFVYLKKEAEKLIALLNIKEGFRIAEIGAGDGSLMEILAKQVGQSGLVFATEQDKERLDKILKKIKTGNLTNVMAVLARGEGSNLPNEQFDVILMKKVFHHITNPEIEVRNFYEHLKPGGKLAIADFEPKWYLKLSTPKNIPKSYGGHGIYKNVLIEKVIGAGFVLEKLEEKFSVGSMYCAIFRKNI